MNSAHKSWIIIRIIFIFGLWINGFTMNSTRSFLENLNGGLIWEPVNNPWSSWFLLGLKKKKYILIPLKTGCNQINYLHWAHCKISAFLGIHLEVTKTGYLISLYIMNTISRITWNAQTQLYVTKRIIQNSR